MPGARIGERLAGLGDQRRQLLGRTVGDADLVVLGPEAIRDLPGVLQLLVAARRVGADASGQPGHQGDQRARVEASGEHGGRAARQPAAHRLFQPARTAIREGARPIRGPASRTSGGARCRETETEQMAGRTLRSPLQAVAAKDVASSR